MASYNHERFVAEAVQSVLAQSFTDLELIITDDGSRDATADIVRSFEDTRIIFEALPQNIGACAASHRSFIKARGQYIALISSDDVWEINKLGRQITLLNENPGCSAVFAKPVFIDELGNIMPSVDNVFDQPDMSRHEWMRFFFFRSNALCHPSVCLRRECYDKLGWYDNRFRQLPDYAMWVRFVKQYEFLVLDERLLRFRLMADQSNASAPTVPNAVRTHNELCLIMRDFFDGMDDVDFVAAFSALFVHPDARTSVELDIEKTLLFLRKDTLAPWLHLIGIERLFHQLASPAHASVLRHRYGISELYLHDLSSRFGMLYHQSNPQWSSTKSTLAAALVQKMRQVGFWETSKKVARRLSTRASRPM